MAKRWYVIHTYSGYENKVKTDLEHRIETYGIGDKVVDIQIPTEEVTEVKDGGKRETKEAKVFPGYVLVRMEVDDNTWAVVRNTPGVTGFVGLDGKPTPLRRDEFDKIMRRGGVRTSAATSHPQAHLDQHRARHVRARSLWSPCRFRRPGLRGQRRGRQGQGHAHDLWPRDPRRAHA